MFISLTLMCMFNFGALIFIISALRPRPLKSSQWNLIGECNRWQCLWRISRYSRNLSPSITNRLDSHQTRIANLQTRIASITIKITIMPYLLLRSKFKGLMCLFGPFMFMYINYEEKTNYTVNCHIRLGLMPLRLTMTLVSIIWDFFPEYQACFICIRFNNH